MKKIALLLLSAICGFVSCPASAADLLYNQDNNSFTSGRKNSMYTTYSGNTVGQNSMAADDFLLGTDSIIKQVNVRGTFNMWMFDEQPLTGFRVSFMSDDASGYDSRPSVGVLKVIDLTMSQVTQVGNQYQLDFSGNASDWFNVTAGTKYWVSVQGKIQKPGSGYSDNGEWLWNWNNDSVNGPIANSAYVPVGSSAASGTGGNFNNNHYRWWKEDFFNGNSWQVANFTGSPPFDGQRLDLNFQLLGSGGAPPTPEPATLALAGIGAAMGLWGLRRKRKSQKRESASHVPV